MPPELPQGQTSQGSTMGRTGLAGQRSAQRPHHLTRQPHRGGPWLHHRNERGVVPQLGAEAAQLEEMVHTEHQGPGQGVAGPKPGNTGSKDTTGRKDAADKGP